MTTEQNLTETEEASFQLLYGFIFSMSMSIEYMDGIKPMLQAAGGRNALSKVLSAEETLKSLKGTIWHHFTKNMPPDQVGVFEQAIESHSETVYKMFSLGPDKQRRVWNLIEKLNKE